MEKLNENVICHKNVKKTLTLKPETTYNVSRHLKEAAQAERICRNCSQVGIF